MGNFRLFDFLFAALMLALALFDANASAQGVNYVSTITNTPGLLGYWDFDPGFLTNSLVNGYQGTLYGNAFIGPPGSGAPVPTDPANQGLLLDGQSSYMVTTLTGQIADAGTTMAWVYLTNYPSVAGRIFQITSEGDDGNDFDFQIDTDDLLHFYTDSGGSTVSPQPVPLNQWHLLAGTFVANSVRVLYIDGIPVATNTPGSHSPDDSYYTIGENLQFRGRYFEGTIAEVAVFNQALSAQEISNIYAAAFNTPVLSINQAGNTVVLSWPTNFPDYTLQTNGLLALPGGWADYPAIFNITGTNYQVIDGIGAAAQFYRLSSVP
jgi:Concanavalin A-like lectin/glucanases superfamily